MTKHAHAKSIDSLLPILALASLGGAEAPGGGFSDLLGGVKDLPAPPMKITFEGSSEQLDVFVHGRVAKLAGAVMEGECSLALMMDTNRLLKSQIDKLTGDLDAEKRETGYVKASEAYYRSEWSRTSVQLATLRTEKQAVLESLDKANAALGAMTKALEDAERELKELKGVSPPSIANLHNGG